MAWYKDRSGEPPASVEQVNDVFDRISRIRGRMKDAAKAAAFNDLLDASRMRQAAEVVTEIPDPAVRSMLSEPMKREAATRAALAAERQTILEPPGVTETGSFIDPYPGRRPPVNTQTANAVGNTPWYDRLGNYPTRMAMEPAAAAASIPLDGAKISRLFGLTPSQQPMRPPQVAPQQPIAFPATPQAMMPQMTPQQAAQAVQPRRTDMVPALDIDFAAKLRRPGMQMTEPSPDMAALINANPPATQAPRFTLPQDKLSKMARKFIETRELDGAENLTPEEISKLVKLVVAMSGEDVTADSPLRQRIGEAIVRAAIAKRENLASAADRANRTTPGERMVKVANSPGFASAMNQWMPLDMTEYGPRPEITPDPKREAEYQAKEQQNQIRRLLDSAKNKPLTNEDSNFAERGLVGLGQQVPNLLTAAGLSLIPYAGGVAAAASYVPEIGETRRAELRQRGLEPELADTVAYMSAIPEAASELLQLNLLKAGFKGQISKAAKRSIARWIAAQAARGTGMVAEQMGQEALQELIGVVSEGIGAEIQKANGGKDIGFDWKQEFADSAQSLYRDTLPTIVAMTAPGMATSTTGNAANTLNTIDRARNIGDIRGNRQNAEIAQAADYLNNARRLAEAQPTSDMRKLLAAAQQPREADVAREAQAMPQVRQRPSEAVQQAQEQPQAAAGATIPAETQQSIKQQKKITDNGPRAIKTQNKDHGFYIITPSARHKGKFQATHFAPDGTPTGHSEHNTIVEALRENQSQLGIKSLQISDDEFNAWFQAMGNENTKDLIEGKNYVYTSLLRPLTGVSVDGVKLSSDNGRIGVLFRDTPLDNDTIKHLSLSAVSPESAESVLTDYAREYGYEVPGNKIKPAPATDAKTATVQPQAQPPAQVQQEATQAQPVEGNAQVQQTQDNATPSIDPKAVRTGEELLDLIKEWTDERGNITRGMDFFKPAFRSVPVNEVIKAVEQMTPRQRQQFESEYREAYRMAERAAKEQVANEVTQDERQAESGPGNTDAAEQVVRPDGDGSREYQRIIINPGKNETPIGDIEVTSENARSIADAYLSGKTPGPHDPSDLKTAFDAMRMLDDMRRETYTVEAESGVDNMRLWFNKKTSAAERKKILKQLADMKPAKHGVSMRKPAVKKPSRLKATSKSVPAFLKVLQLHGGSTSSPNMQHMDIGDSGKSIVHSNGNVSFQFEFSEKVGDPGAYKINKKGELLLQSDESLGRSKSAFTNGNKALANFNYQPYFDKIDIETLKRVSAQAKLMTEGDTDYSLLIVRNPDGSLGAAADVPGVGTYEHNVALGHEIAASFDAKNLMQTVDTMSAAGIDTFSFSVWTTVTENGKTKFIARMEGIDHSGLVTKSVVYQAGVPIEMPESAVDPEAATSARVSSPGKLGTPETSIVRITSQPAGDVKPIAPSEVIKTIRREFSIPVTGRATHQMKVAAGWYETKPQGIRQKDIRNLATAVHELGHHLDWGLGDRASKSAPAAVKQDLIRMGKALYGETKPAGGYASEGFAEIVRGYMLGYDMQNFAPQAWPWFKRNFMDAMPDVGRKLETLQSQMTRWRTQGAEARVAAMIQSKPERFTVRERMRDASIWFTDNFRDKNDIFRRLREAAGLDLDPSMDPFKVATAFQDKAPSVARSMVLNGTTDMAGNPTGIGLREALAPVPRGQIKNFMLYAVAKRAKLINESGRQSGFLPSDIDAVIAKYDNPTWQKVLNDVTAWNQRIMDYLVEAGNMTAEEAKVIKEGNPIYVPFQRVFLEGEKRSGGGGIGRGVSNTGKGVKRLKGSSREIMDPLEAMIQQTEKMIGIAHKSYLGRTIANLADKKGMAGWIWEVPPPRQATKFSASQIKGDVAQMLAENLGMDPTEISDMLGEWDDVLTVYSNAWDYRGKDNILPVVVNGKRKFYQVNPDLYAAMKGLDPYVLPKFLNMTLGASTRMVRLGATGINPGFGLLRNFMRDAMTFSVLSEYSRFGPLSAAGGVLADIRGTDAAKRFIAAGGQMAGMIGRDRAATRQLRREVTTTTIGGKTVLTVAHPIDAMRKLFGITESGTRIAEYANALKATEAKYGKNTLDAHIEAFNAAQDVTTNFSRSGKIGRIINQIIPFFNARIQGIDKVARTFKQRPAATTLAAMGYLTLPALMLWWLDKDEDYYKNMPSYERANYLHFRIPGTDTVIRIPVPFELGHVFQSAPMAALDAQYRKDPETVKEVWGDILDSNTDLGWPALIGPIVEVMSNKDFADRPIVSESVKRKQPADQYGNYTTELMKAIGKAINYSPAKLEHLVNGYSGGLYSRVSRTIENAQAEPGTRSKSDLPVVGTLFMREPYAPRAQVDRFYRRRDELQAAKNSDRISELDDQKRLAYNRASGKLTQYWNALKQAKTEQQRKQIYEAIRRQIEPILERDKVVRDGQ